MKRTIMQCLDSVLQTDYPKDRLEIFVVDGLTVACISFSPKLALIVPVAYAVIPIIVKNCRKNCILY